MMTPHVAEYDRFSPANTIHATVVIRNVLISSRSCLFAFKLQSYLNSRIPMIQWSYTISQNSLSFISHFDLSVFECLFSMDEWKTNAIPIFSGIFSKFSFVLLLLWFSHQQCVRLSLFFFSPPLFRRHSVIALVFNYSLIYYCYI